MHADILNTPLTTCLQNMLQRANLELLSLFKLNGIEKNTFWGNSCLGTHTAQVLLK